MFVLLMSLWVWKNANKSFLVKSSLINSNERNVQRKFLKCELKANKDHDRNI